MPGLWQLFLLLPFHAVLAVITHRSGLPPVNFTGIQDTGLHCNAFHQYIRLIGIMQECKIIFDCLRIGFPISVDTESEGYLREVLSAGADLQLGQIALKILSFVLAVGRACLCQVNLPDFNDLIVVQRALQLAVEGRLQSRHGGDGLRPGCIADATDRAQIQELLNLGELTQRAWDKGVQVMVEGPGHVPYNQIAANMQLQKRLCHGAPFYVLGPLVTDVAPGYDHITSAIGGTLAAVSGANFLCYVTPAEHLGLPDLNDVREGVIATRIAAHAADLANGNKQAWEWDLKMARARKVLDWPAQLDLAIDPVKAKEYRCRKNKSDDEACSMCGDYCAVKIVGQYLEEHMRKN